MYSVQYTESLKFCNSCKIISFDHFEVQDISSRLPNFGSNYIASDMP